MFARLLTQDLEYRELQEIKPLLHWYSERKGRLRFKTQKLAWRANSEVFHLNQASTAVVERRVFVCVWESEREKDHGAT